MCFDIRMGRIIPGSSQRCQAIITSRLNPDRTGEQCKNWKMEEGGDYCAVHRNWGDRRCKGTYSQGHEKAGERCVQVAMRGQEVCEKHGGLRGKKAVAAKEKEQKLQARMVKLLERFGAEDIERIDNPLEALKIMATEIFHHKEEMRQKVAELQGEIRYESKAGGEQLRAEMALYERAMDRCVNLLAGIAKLNIDERLAKIEEAKILLIINSIDAGINKAGITGQEAVKIRRAIARELREANHAQDKP